MSGENQNVNTDVSGASDANTENMVNIDGAELKLLQAQAKAHGKLAEEAEDAGYDSPEEYMDFLETTAYANRTNTQTPPENNAGTQSNTDANKATDNQQTQTKDNQVDANSVLERAEAATRNSYGAVIETSWMTHNFEQGQLPEKERHGFSRDQLNKIMANPGKGPIVAKLSREKEFDGNIYKAAAHYLTVFGKASDLRQQGADAEKVRQTSQQAVAGKTGTTITDTKDNLTAEEQADKDFMGRIAPDTRYTGE